MLLEETETFAYKITYVVYVSIGLKKLRQNINSVVSTLAKLDLTLQYIL